MKLLTAYRWQEGHGGKVECICSSSSYWRYGVCCRLSWPSPLVGVGWAGERSSSAFFYECL